MGVLAGPTTAAQAQRVASLELVSWAVAKRIKFAGVRPEVREGTRGMFATYNVPAGSTLVSVPQVAALVCTPTQPPPKGQPELEAAWDGLPWYAKQAVNLMLLQGEQAFAPYLRMLPTAAQVDLPVSWAPAEVAQLQCAYIISKVQQEQQEQRQLAQQLGAWLRARGRMQEDLTAALAIVRSRSFAGPHFTIPIPVLVGLFVALQALAAGAHLTQPGTPWAWEAAEACAWVAPGALAAWDIKNAQTKVSYAVAPFLDMCNHSSKVKAEVGFDWLKRAYSVAACRDYSPGQEVCISYGELSNDALLLLYGFVEEGNPHDRYVISDLGRWLLSGPLAQLEGPGAVAALSDAVAAATTSGLLVEVPLTAGGCPPDVVTWVQQVAQTLVAQQPLAGGSSSSGGSSSASDLASAALAHACRQELGALGSTLDADRQELQELEGLIARKLAPAPPPPAIAPQPREDQQGGAHQGGGSSTAASHSTGEQEGVHQDELQQQQQPGEQPGGQQPHLQPEGEEGMRAGGDGVGPLPAEDPALVALDLGLAARQRTWLRYRIQKKQVLHGLL